MKKNIYQKIEKAPKNFKELFWWCKFSGIDIEKHKKLIIVQTINYGNWRHWLWIIKRFGKKELKTIIEEIPISEFRFRALKLICLLLGIAKLKYAHRNDYIKANKNS